MGDGTLSSDCKQRHGFQKNILYVEGYSWLREGWSAQEEQAKVSLLPQRLVNISNMSSSGSR